MRGKVAAALLLAGALIATILMPPSTYVGAGQPPSVGNVLPNVQGSAVEQGCAAWGETMEDCTSHEAPFWYSGFAKF
jgi:hypothetical protein